MRNIDIGILLAHEVDFRLVGNFLLNGKYLLADEEYKAVAKDGRIIFQGDACERLHFVPQSAECRIVLHKVLIGVDFHWERYQEQMFEGELVLFSEDDKVRVVNSLPVEDYLKSVISSEMAATSSLEFLKAHTVISRSWLYAQLARRNKEGDAQLCRECGCETVRWYARENHTLFDLCADDHCQRYQGLSHERNMRVEEAVKSTSGQVLVYGGEVCDARFSKCCGGMTERFSACWEDKDFDYLQAFRDNKDKDDFVDLTIEENVRRWIEDAPDSFCNTGDKEVLGQVLNGYDCETNDFYRWTVKYTQQELSDIVSQRSGVDFGTIEELVPVERAASGRLVRLRIVGDKASRIVGKELEIRRWLSPSHLYSSAFVVDKCVDSDGNRCFLLKGAGWGHGVGLCQIGAAMMGERGYDYHAILQHYYPGAVIDDIGNIDFIDE